MNILITGGLGILGNSLVKLLAKNNNNSVIVLDKFKNRKKFIHNKKNIKFVTGNFTNFSDIKKIIKKFSIQAIFHLGAITTVLDALKKPHKTMKTNVMGTVNILESIRLINKDIILIYSSSDKAYGEVSGKASTRGFKENSRFKSKYPYDVSKSTSDMICESYSHTYNVKVGIIRSANIYGPADFNLQRIVPDAILSSFANKKLTIRSSGKLKRDYIYVDDAAEAYFLVFKEILNSNNLLKIYNIGTKDNFNTIELLEKINKLLKKPILFEINDSSKKETAYKKLNYDKITKELKWMPRTDINKGLQKTISWYWSNFNKFKDNKKYRK